MDLNLKKHIRDKGKTIYTMIGLLTKGQHMSIRPRLSDKRGKIYDIYKSSPVYDESLIKVAFPDDTQEALHRAKSILFDEIIAGVVAHEKHNGRRDLYRHIVEANYLREAGMDEAALIRAYDAIRLAVGMEAMSELLQATKICRKLIGMLDPADRHEDQLFALEEWALSGTEETTRMDRLEASLHRLSLLPVIVHHAEVGKLEATLDGIPFPELVRNQIQYHRVRHYIARQRQDLNACIAESEAIYNLGDKHQHVLVDKDIREAYFFSITFLTTASADNKDFLKAEKYLNQIPGLAKKWGGGLESNPSLNASYMFSRLAIKINSKDWKAAHGLAKKVLQEVVKQKVLNDVALQTSVLRIAMWGAFFNRDYSLTRKLTNAMREGIAVTNQRANPTLRSAMVCLFVLLSYLEEEDPHLRVATKEMSMWLLTFGPMGEYESHIIKFFKRVSETAACSPTTASLITLRADLLALFEDKRMARYRTLFPILAWIDSKVDGKDIREYDWD